MSNGLLAFQSRLLEISTASMVKYGTFGMATSSTGNEEAVGILSETSIHMLTSSFPTTGFGSSLKKEKDWRRESKTFSLLGKKTDRSWKASSRSQPWSMRRRIAEGATMQTD